MGLFDSPSNAADRYIKKIPGAISPYYDPYIQAGNRQLDILEPEYANLINSPGTKLNDIGSSYQQSPGFEFALKQALGASGNAAAAGGMAGSPQHEYQNMDIATGMANQDYNQWMNNALGLYGTGISGSQGLYNTGVNAANTKAGIIAGNLENRAGNAYAGQANQNAMIQGLIGAGMGAAMGPIGSYFGASATPAYLDPFGLF